jgi:undecaprenyl-diphosphatase
MAESRLSAWIGAREARTIAALLVAAGALWLFVELADEVLEGETASVDERVLLMLRAPGDTTDPLGPAWVEELARDATGVGGAGFLTFLTLASAGFVALQRKSHFAVYLLTAVAGGTLLSTLLKLAFDRPRPDLVPHGSLVYTSSFPSGHSMLSAVTFLTLGALLAHGQTNFKIRMYLVALAIVLTVSVGLSRVYLGVHWPTDVLAGWTAGAAWTLICWAVADRLHRRGVVE